MQYSLKYRSVSVISKAFSKASSYGVLGLYCGEAKRTRIWATISLSRPSTNRSRKLRHEVEIETNQLQMTNYEHYAEVNALADIG